MVFTIEEIKNYLKSKQDLTSAISDLSEVNVTACNDYPKAFNYELTPENAKKYEIQIGMAKLKEEQLIIRRNSNGKKGKYWLACSPRWIDEPIQKKMGTEYLIAYWVNYGDDETYGLFTVEQIKKWLTTPDLKLHTIAGTRERVKS